MATQQQPDTGVRTVGGQVVQPVQRVTSGAAATSWFDFSGAPAWRLLWFAIACGYVGLFHFTLPGGIATVGRSGAGLPHGHPMGIGMYLAAWMIIIDGTRDVVAYAWPHAVPAISLHQSL